jgi:hypothetical protein
MYSFLPVGLLRWLFTGLFSPHSLLSEGSQLPIHEDSEMESVLDSPSSTPANLRRGVHSLPVGDAEMEKPVIDSSTSTPVNISGGVQSLPVGGGEM